MPIDVIQADEAVRIRKANSVSKWGGRGPGNRVEPFARPTFDVPFRFEPGARIFTIGSCFARNIEVELMARGFVVPTRDILSDPVLGGLGSTVINNYGAPSIYNEFYWALEGKFTPEDHILAVRGGYVDIHLPQTLRPEPFDVVVARRSLVTSATASVKTCPVVVMTLGLAECWYDTRTGNYLNMPPRPSMLQDHPGRFELHVLSFEDVLSHLERTFFLLRKHAPEQHVILTVSPVPLTETHRNMDVMTANAYSKSVLRAASEHIIAKFSNVVYFPSYESVTLSNREVAWRDDFVHVTDAIVAMNVERLISAYSGGDATLDAIEAEIEAGGEGVAIEKARSGDDAFFLRFSHLGGRWPSFAIEHARFVASRDPKKALRILDGVPAHVDPLTIGELRFDALSALKRPAEAAQALAAVLAPNTRIPRLWEKLLTAYALAGMTEAEEATATAYAKVIKGRDDRIAYARAKAHRLVAPDRAKTFFGEVLRLPGSTEDMKQTAAKFIAANS